MRSVVVLDDYQGRTRTLADWDGLGPDVAVNYVREHLEGEDLYDALRDAEVIVATRERTRLHRNLLERLSKLELIASCGVRNVAIDMQAAADLGIVVSASPTDSKAVTEHTWALLLALRCHIVETDREIRAGTWQPRVRNDLAGSTLGIAGLGKLGSSMVPLAHHFGMSVIAWSQNLKADYAASLGVRAVSKEELLARSDTITIHLKLSERTEGIFGADELSAMKPTAGIVNTSRGPIIVEDALVAALRDHRIAGAALDVFDEEPLRADHPFLSLENVVLTPHLGYATEAMLSDWYTVIVADIKAHFAGGAVHVMASSELVAIGGSARDARATTERDNEAIDQAAIAEFNAVHGMPRLSPVAIVIAAYKERENIGRVIATMAPLLCGLRVSVLVVVDGEEDGTAAIVRAAGHCAIVAPVNRGQGAALRLGYRVAREYGATYIVTADADGQTDPAGLEVVLAPIVAGELDFVNGSRRLGSTESHDAVRNTGVVVFAAIITALTRTKVTDTANPVRAMHASLSGEFQLDEPQYQASELLLSAIMGGARFGERPVRMLARARGKSKKGGNFRYGYRYGRVLFRTYFREQKRRASLRRAP